MYMHKIYVEPDLEKVYFTFEQIMTGSIDGTELLGGYLAFNSPFAFNVLQ